MTTRESTTVVIVGGGAAGLTAAKLLQESGVGCVVLERQSRAYVERRQRAGVVEYRAVRMFRDWGLDRLLGDFPANTQSEFRIDGEALFLTPDSFSAGATAQQVPQQALVRALIAAFTADDGDLRFEAADVALHGLDTERPTVAYTGSDGGRHEIECDFVAGCDGDHGSTHSAVPDGALTEYATDFGITWLTVLADAPPPRHPCLATGERGYAAHFARGPAASRFYLAVPPDDTPADWPAGRIWEQLRFRLHQPGLPDGPITETEIFPLRALVREPMSYGRLYLLGDAAHIISPMGAKGMNLALRDAEVFATAVRDFVRDGDATGLREYSGTCLARVWKYQEWSEWLLEMMHGICPANSDPFRARLLRARLDRMTSTETGSRYWAEMMTGLG